MTVASESLTIALGCPVAAAVVDAADNDELCDHGECDEEDDSPRAHSLAQGEWASSYTSQLVWRGGCSFDSAIARATSLRFHGGIPRRRQVR